MFDFYDHVVNQTANETRNHELNYTNYCTLTHASSANQNCIHTVTFILNIVFEYRYYNLNLDCIYHFPIELAPNGIPLGAKF